MGDDHLTNMVSGDFDDFMHMNTLMENACTYYAAIPDIHGELEELDRVLAGIEAWRKHNKVHKSNLKRVFLGDYIDRGEDSSGVIMRVKHCVEKYGDICLLGNHDMFLIGTADMTTTEFPDSGKVKSHSFLWEINNGQDTCHQMFGGSTGKPLERNNTDIPVGFYVDMYRDQILASGEYKFLKEHGKMFYETKDIFFCHAPQSKKVYDDNTLLWSRTSDYKNNKGDACFITPNDKLMSVHGHIHKLTEGFNFPRIHRYLQGGTTPKQVILADSGCGFGEPLRAVIIKEYDIAKRWPYVAAII